MFDKSIDTMNLFRDIDRLRAMRRTLVTPDTVIRLPELGHTAIVPHQKSPPGLPVTLVPAVLRHIPLIDTLIIMQQNSRNIDPVRARHTIFTIVTGNRRILHHQVRRLVQKPGFLLRQRYQGRISADIILQMLHISHTAQHRKHMLRRPRIPESPRSHTIAGTPLLQPRHDMIVHIGKPPPPAKAP